MSGKKHRKTFEKSLRLARSFTFFATPFLHALCSASLVASLANVRRSLMSFKISDRREEKDDVLLRVEELVLSSSKSVQSVIYCSVVPGSRRLILPAILPMPVPVSPINCFNGRKLLLLLFLRR